MSSVTRFLRQIPVATTYYSLPDGPDMLFTFEPSASNYVGNYPPGTVDVTQEGIDWLYTLGVYDQNDEPNRNGFVLRDMGKTIKDIVTNNFFRQVQVLSNGAPDAVSGITGGPVTPSADSKFGTFYIPVKIAGNGASAPGAYAIAGGQM
jgi:hypothetical protein